MYLCISKKMFREFFFFLIRINRNKRVEFYYVCEMYIIFRLNILIVYNIYSII